MGGPPKSENSSLSFCARLQAVGSAAILGDATTILYVYSRHQPLDFSMSAVSFLISDRSHALQKFVQQVLASYGFDAASIKTADDPHAAAEVAQSLRPDFLLTDWFAKESLSGIALYRSILKTSPHCRFALLSDSNSPSHRQEEAAQAGAMFLLAKPFTADDMRSALGKALEQLAPSHPHIAQRLHSGSQAPSRPVKLQLPNLPQFKPGDRVLYANRTESVKHVILRRGELVVQLEGFPGLIEASKISPR
jgi:CheY-like chemotaxis protein